LQVNSVFLFLKLLASQILKYLLRQSNALMVARPYFFELKGQVGNTLRKILQSCNKKYAVFQLRWLLLSLPFHVLGKVLKRKQKNGISANSLKLRDFTLQVSGTKYY
jgi:hypothetical protein